MLGSAALLQRIKDFVSRSLTLKIENLFEKILNLIRSIVPDHDESGILNAAEAEQAFVFFDACQNEEAIKEWVKPTKLEFEERMRRYCRSIWKKMEIQMETIKANRSEGASLRQLAQQLHRQLQEAQTWRATCPRVYKELGGKPGFIEEWAKRLGDVRSEYEELLLKDRDKPDIVDQTLEAAEVLAALDDFMERGREFQKLFKAGMVQVCAKNAERVQSARDIIKEHRWTTQSSELLNSLYLDTRIDAAEVIELKGKLNDEVQLLIDEAASLASDLDEISESKLENIMDLLAVIPELQQMCSSVLDLCSDEVQDSFDACMNQVRKVVASKMIITLDEVERLLSNEESSLNEDSMREAERRIHEVKSVRDCVVNIKSSLCAEDIINKLQQVEHMFETELNFQQTASRLIGNIENLKSRSVRMDLGSELAQALEQMHITKLPTEIHSIVLLRSENLEKNLSSLAYSELERIEGRLAAIFGKEEDGDEGSDSFDATEAERAFDFFEACRHQDAIKEAVKPLEREFEDSMRRHCRSIWLQMQARLGTIKADSDADASMRRQLARELHGRLQEAQEWRAKCPRVYKGLGGKPGFIEEWVERLEELRSELEVETTKLRYQGRQDVLVRRLEVAHALSVLDRYLSEGQRFQKLFTEGMAEVCAKNETRIQGAKEAIRQHRWTAQSAELLAELFEDAYIVSESLKLRADLSKTVQGLIDEATKVALSVPEFVFESHSTIEYVQAVAKFLPEIREVRRFVLDLCDENTQAAFHGGLDKVRDILRERMMMYLDTIERLLTDGLLSAKQLEHAERNVNIIGNVRAIVMEESEEDHMKSRIVKAEELVKAELHFQDKSSKIIQEVESLKSRASKMDLGAELAQTLSLIYTKKGQSAISTVSPSRAQHIERSLASCAESEYWRIEGRLAAIFGKEEDGDEGSDSFDATEAERAFDFFEACRHQDAIKEAVKPLEREFEDSMRRHCRSIWLQMQARLGTIKADSDADASMRRQLARELHGRLQEAQEWRAKCPRVYKGLGGKPGFIEEWVERLEELRSELEVETTKLRYQGRQDVLVRRLEVAHALSVLDRYLSEGQRFQKLFTEGMAEVCAKNETRIQGAKEAIRQHRWTAQSAELLAELLADTDQSSEGQRVMAELSDEVGGLVEGCSRQLISCPPFALDSVAAIHFAQDSVKLWAELESVRRTVLKFCTDKVQRGLRSCLEQMRQVLHDRAATFLDGIEGFLSSEDESVDLLRHTELNLCIIRRVRDVLVAEDPALFPQALVDRLECVEFDFKAQAAARVSRYTDLPVGQYLQSPPKEAFRLFEMLAPVEGSSAEIPSALQLRGEMQLLKAALEAAVKKAIREFLLRASMAGDIDCQELKELQKALPSLPDSLLAELAGEVSECKERIQLNLRTNDLMFDEALRARSWQTMQELLDKGGPASACRGKLCLELERLQLRVSAALDQRSPPSACAELRELLAFRNGLRRVREVGLAVDAMKRRVGECWEEAMRFVCYGLRSAPMAQIQRSYAFLVDLARLSQDASEDWVGLLPDEVDWRRSCEHMYAEIAEFFEGLHDQFVAALSARPRDVAGAVAALDALDAGEGLWALAAQHLRDGLLGIGVSLFWGRGEYEEAAERLIQEMRSALGADLLNEQTIAMDRGRDEYYRALRQHFELVDTLGPVLKRLGKDGAMAAVHRQCMDGVLANVQLLYDEAAALVERPGPLGAGDLGRFNLLHRNLEVLEGGGET